MMDDNDEGNIVVDMLEQNSLVDNEQYYQVQTM
jgi:hypothetical protein